MCAARATEMQNQLADEAKERQRARKGNQPGATQENFPELPSGQSRDWLGEQFGVSGRSVGHAKRALRPAAGSRAA
jgi:hypothetical protein